MKTYSDLGVVHKLRWQDFGFFWILPTCIDIFYGMNVDKKCTFLDHLSAYFVLNVFCVRPPRNSTHTHLFLQKFEKKKKLLEFRCKTSRLLCYLGLKMNTNCKGLAPKSWKTQKLKVEHPFKTVCWIVFGFTDFYLECIFLWWSNVFETGFFGFL